MLQLSKTLHDHPEKYVPNEAGEILLTEGEFEAVIDEMRSRLERGWPKRFRDAGTKAVCAELVETMKEWMMAETDEAAGLIRIKPLLGVLAGEYPADFEKGVEQP